MLTDGGNAAGSVLAGLEPRKITAFAPAKSSAPAADSPVLREGVEVCDTEWRWSCLSLNMKKLVRYIRRIRQELEELLDAAPDSVERSEKCPAGA